LFTSGYEVRGVEIGGSCGMRGGERDAYNVLVVRHEGRRLFVKPKRRWDDNIKIYHKKIECVWTRFVSLRMKASGGLLLRL